MDYGHQIQKCTPFVFQTQSEALFSRSDVVLALQTIWHIESPQVDAHITIADGCVYAVAEMNAIVNRSRFSGSVLEPLRQFLSSNVADMPSCAQTHNDKN